MKVKIQLFGVLAGKLPEYGAPEGVEIELPDGSTVGDLLEYLKIPDGWTPAVAVNSRLLKSDSGIRDGAEIRIFQAVHGG